MEDFAGSSIMNAITLYLSTCKLIMKIDKDDPTTWTDLYRLVPYLRQSLSCSVCSNLALDPQTPSRGNCQHHVCRACQNGRKKLKPSCQCCRVYTEYRENWQLRSIQRCYKQLCVYFKTTAAYKNIFDLALNSNDSAASNLMELICEASLFTDNYKNLSSQTDYSILPYVYVSSAATNQNSRVTFATTSTYTLSSSSATSTKSSISVPNGQEDCSMQSQDSMVDVLFTTRPTFNSNTSLVNTQNYSIPTNKILNFKRSIVTGTPNNVIHNQVCNNDDVTTNNFYMNEITSSTCTPVNTNFKKPATNRGSSRSVQVRRKGCRCGNATPTPGKLTCCGQRCPCYVDGKACLECRCRGCRNPHRADGVKVRPHIPATQNLHIHYPDTPKVQVDIEPDPISLNTISFSTPNLKVVGLYSGDLNQISSTVPSAILMGDETSDILGEGENSDLDLDI